MRARVLKTRAIPGSYARMYDDVQRMGRIFISADVLAIIVACLGLFALSAFMVEQRSKEISIRICNLDPIEELSSLKLDL